ncbi:MAG: hypothetical protein K2J88_05665, partial [Oscillospiraceae bacterium]|nr:hypothetical protein [Oscillospiraceae bacterium]
FGCIWEQGVLNLCVVLLNLLNVNFAYNRKKRPRLFKIIIIWIAVSMLMIIGDIFENFRNNQKNIKQTIALSDGKNILLIESEEKSTATNTTYPELTVYQTSKFGVRECKYVYEDMFVNQHMLKNQQVSYTYDENTKIFTLLLDYGDLNPPYEWKEKTEEHPTLWEYEIILE